ncbi:MAG: hypothetical protein HY258_12365 [Chloroflexi bacterium]|nr:hypothetical protein [Chloroflexota bacterium]
MKSAQGDKVYTSPLRILARFFEKSRNRWKAKCVAAKAKVKRLSQRVAFLEQSRERWKHRAKELETELAEVKTKAQVLERMRDAQTTPPVPVATPASVPEEFTQIPSSHQYSLGHAQFFVALVLSAAVSLRGASRAMEITFSLLHLPLAWPTWSTGRLWLVRLGYYKLTRAKCQADDWVWIVDHTLQIGPDKCLVILGVRLSALPPAGQCVRHEDVEPLALYPVTRSNGQVVYQQLEDTLAKTGVPREIISDHGADVWSGVEQFCQAHPETCAVYDIKHKAAAVLKHALEQDTAWHTFTQQAAQTKSQLQQTALAPLTPPQQRSKARYMNVDVLIAWGQAILALLDHPPEGAGDAFDQVKVHAKLGWLMEYRQQLSEWSELLQLVVTVESFVRQQGLYHGAHNQLTEQLPLAQTERAQRVRAELLTFVAEQEAQAHVNERLLGSSEVIESVLGKLKRVEHQQAQSGFTGLVLSMCALVSATTKEVIQKALETVPTKKVQEWCQKTLGTSVQARRRQLLVTHKQAKQKRTQFCVAT